MRWPGSACSTWPPKRPWRCPDDCPSYAPRLADVGWAHGSLVEPPLEADAGRARREAASLLDQAEDIVNAVGPEVLAEVEAEEAERRAEAGDGGGAAAAEVATRPAVRPSSAR